MVQLVAMIYGSVKDPSTVVESGVDDVSCTCSECLHRISCTSAYDGANVDGTCIV